MEFRLGARIFCGLLPPALSPSLECGKCDAPLSLPHALSCKSLRARFRRHDALLDDVMQWLRRRRVNVYKEVSGLCSGNERVDLLVRCEGLVYRCDVSVAEPASSSYLDQSSVIT